MATRTTQSDVEQNALPAEIVDADWSEPNPDDIELEKQAEEAERVVLDGLEIDTHNHEYYAYVYKKVNGRKEYCEQIGIENFPLQERLRTRWNGGVFEVIVFKDGKIWKNKTYRVHTQPNNNDVKVSPTTKESELGAIAEMLRQQSELIANMQQGPARSDPMDDMNRMLTMMKMVKELTPDVKQADPTAMLLKGVELMEKLRGDESGGERNLYSLLESFIKSPMAEGLAQQAQTPQPNPMARPLAQQTPEPALQQPQTPMPEALKMLPPQMQAQLRDMILYWLDRAKQNKDPALYAELAVDTYPKDFCSQVIMNPDKYNVIYYFAPEVQSNAELIAWYDEFFTAVHMLLTDAANETTNAEVDTGIVNAPQQEPAPTAENLDHSEWKSGGESDFGHHAEAGAGREEGRGS